MEFVGRVPSRGGPCIASSFKQAQVPVGHPGRRNADPPPVPRGRTHPPAPLGCETAPNSNPVPAAAVFEGQGQLERYRQVFQVTNRSPGQEGGIRRPKSEATAARGESQYIRSRLPRVSGFGLPSAFGLRPSDFGAQYARLHFTARTSAPRRPALHN